MYRGPTILNTVKRLWDTMGLISCMDSGLVVFSPYSILFSFRLPVCNARPIDRLDIYNMHPYA